MRFASSSMSWRLSFLAILVEYPSQRSLIFGKSIRWTSPFQERAPFPLSNPQGGSCVTALPIPPKRKSKKHEVKNMKRKHLVLFYWFQQLGSCCKGILEFLLWMVKYGLYQVLFFFAYKSIESILRRHLTSAVLQVYWRSSLQITLMTCYQLPIILLFGLASWWYLVLVI